MPQYKTHLVGGLVAFNLLFILLYLINIPMKYILVYLIACLLGSLFPDIDTKSIIQKYTFFALFLIMNILLLSKNYKVSSVLGTIFMIPLISKHRQLTHKLWFIVIAPIIIPIIINSYYPKYTKEGLLIYLFFVFGELSHVYLDFGLKKMFLK